MIISENIIYFGLNYYKNLLNLKILKLLSIVQNLNIEHLVSKFSEVFYSLTLDMYEWKI